MARLCVATTVFGLIHRLPPGVPDSHSYPSDPSRIVRPRPIAADRSFTLRIAPRFSKETACVEVVSTSDRRQER